MKILSKLFGRKEDRTSLIRVRAIMGPFIKACFLTLGERQKDSSEGLVLLLFMLGAVDMLCQVHDIDKEGYLALFEIMLRDELGGYSDVEARIVLDAVIQATAENDSRRTMKEGAESLRMWLLGEDVAAPHRLTELLNSLRH